MSEVELRGARLSFDVSGDRGASGSSLPLPFVWGHGLTSSRVDEDRFPLIDCARVATDRSVLRYDARGHGTSSALGEPRDGDWAALARDQVALIDHLAWRDVTIGGASMGAATALHAALELRERVRAMVLVIPPTGWETRAEQVDLYEQMALAVERDGVGVLEAGARAMPPPDPFVGASDYLDRRIAVLASADPRRLSAALRAAGTADLPSADAIGTISAPTLVLAWTGDAGHPVSTAERLGELLAQVEVVVASTRDELDTWTGRCVDFLAAVDRR